MKSVRLLSLFFAFAMLFLDARAQDEVEFIVKGLEAGQATAISHSGSKLMTVINRSQRLGEDLDLSSLPVNEYAAKKLRATWADCPFRTIDIDVIKNGKVLRNGTIEVRDIDLIMKPTEEQEGDWKTYQSGVLQFDKNGVITDFRLALDPKLYASVMNMAKNVVEQEQLQQIHEYMERFRNAYNTKDLEFLKNIYSDDALIITGTVVSRKKSNLTQDNVRPQIKKTEYTKAAYIEHLSKVFNNNRKISVTFADYNIKRHPARKNIYAVQVFQGYRSDHYSDEGYLFLLWDFNDPEHPQIHLRVWEDKRIFDDMPDMKPFDITPQNINLINNF